MIERYGFKYSYQNEDIKNKFLQNIEETTKKTNKTKVERGLMVDHDNCKSFKEYRKLVDIETRKHKKYLYENWNGLDYYDNKNIKDNLNLNHVDKNYPSIDHKNSVLYGFKNNIDPYTIGNIENLCITTRSNNSIKHSKNFF